MIFFINILFCFSLAQLKRMFQQKQYAMEIKAALDLVKEFQAGFYTVLCKCIFCVGFPPLVHDFLLYNMYL